MLLFGLLGVQIPPRPGTGQLCPSQAELCSPQLWVRAAGMVGGTWGETLPLPAPCLLPCLPGTPNSPCWVLLRGSHTGAVLPLPPAQPEGPIQYHGGVSPWFTPPAAHCQRESGVGAPPQWWAETPASPRGLLPPSSGGWQGSSGAVTHTTMVAGVPWQGATGPALMAASPPIPVGSSLRNVWASLARVRSRRGDVGALPPPPPRPGPALAASHWAPPWGSWAGGPWPSPCPPPLPSVCNKTFLELRACE